MGDTEEVYTTLYPPTGETVKVSRGSGFLALEAYDGDGERVGFQMLGRDDLLEIAKGGL